MEDTAQAMGYLRNAIALSEKTNDKKRMSRSYLQLARFYDQYGQLSEAQHALAHVEQQLAYFHDTAIEATFFMLRGIIYYFEGTYDKAIDDMWKARSLYELLGDSTTVASCYINIGVDYLELDNPDKALEYYQKGLEVYKNTGYEKGVAMALGNIGVIYKIKNDFDKALDYYHQSLQVNEQHGYLEEARVDLNNIGVLYEEKGDYKKASEFHKKSQEVSESLDSPWGILSSKFNLALIAFKIGNYGKAIYDFDEIIETAQVLNYKEFIKDSYKVLSEIYQKTGNLQLALDYRIAYETWKDSLISEHHLNQVAELETKYETEKKEKQIALLAQEKKIQEKEAQRQATMKKASLGGLFAVLLLASLFIYLLRQRIKNQKLLAAKNEEVKQAQFKQQLTELETKALRAQINPHFMFNCLNSINRMILHNETDNASCYLAKFSKLIRLILENAEETTVSLEKELALLESYIQLEALRFKGKINYQISVDESVDPEETYLPSMVLQPFVENAIWHGLTHKETAELGMINIVIKEEDDRLLCTIEDNGIGREQARILSEKSVLKSKSLGMKITEERLRLLSKKQLEKLINITDLKDSMNRALGTRVDILLPIT